MSSPLIGRTEELASLETALERLKLGHGWFALVEGEPGIGKSRLVEECIALAAAYDVGILLGSARELEQELPFAPIAAALGVELGSDEPERASLADLLFGPDPSSGAQLHLRILAGLTNVIERQSEEVPVLLVMEDLHWADPSTLLFLDRVVSRKVRLPLGLLATARPYPRSRPLEGLAASIRKHGSVIGLGSLSAEEVVQLVSHRIKDPSDDLIRRLDSAGGNPLFVIELVDALREGRQVPGSAITPTITETIRERYGDLPERTTALLLLASVLGTRFQVGDLALVSGVSAVEVVERLGPALSSGIIREDGSALAFRHDLVHEALYQETPGSARKALHRNVGMVLAEAGRSAGVVASHFARGAERGDTEAIEWLRRAAGDAALRAPSVAVEQLRHAIDLAGPDHPDLDEMRVDLAAALIWTGGPVEAERLARDVLMRAASDTPLFARATIALIECLTVRGELRRAVNDLEAAERFVDEVQQRYRPVILAALARTRLQLVHEAKTRELASRAIDAAREVGDHVSEAASIGILSLLDFVTAHTGSALQRSRESLHLVKRHSIEARILESPGFLLGTALQGEDRYQEALEVFREAEREAAAFGNIRSLINILQQRAPQYYFAGLWDEAIADCETALAIGAEAGIEAWTFVARANLARIAVSRGEVARAHEVFEGVEAGLRNFDWTYHTILMLIARSALLEAEGDPYSAHESLEAARILIERTGLLYLTLRYAPRHIRMAKEVGRSEAIGPMLELIREAARRSGTRSARAQALLCEGLVTCDAEKLVRAAEEQALGPIVTDHAWGSEDAADQLAADGRGEEAVRFLGSAAEVWTRTGAARELARVDAKLRALGVRPSPRRRRAAARTGWESLTDTELRVVRLIEEGLLYREIADRLFISRRTVETHVAHVFEKIGVSSRRELVSSLAARSS